MGAAILPASRRRRAVRSLEALVIFGLVASALAPGLRPGVLAAAAVLCALRPLFVRAERRPWLVLAIALTFRLAGIHPAFYPAAAIALALLARDGAAKAQDRDVGPWLDIAAAALAAATVIVAMARSVVAVRDVRSLADSRRQARTDELTNLGNRRMFYEQLDKALANRAEQEGLALLLVDLDRFKEINDSLGHRVGDELLRQIGPRLDSAMRPGDVLARLGGDEFALLVPASGPDFAREIAARIRAAIAQPFR